MRKKQENFLFSAVSLAWRHMHNMVMAEKFLFQNQSIKTINIDQAALFLGAHKETIRPWPSQEKFPL
ncbi:hypothetical protein [Legionella taurinensis]|uniref:hypothetical protein n=1 Tax=Legionella taurinensis TaxID=70611 RepID=UPI001F5EBC5A|nr:hypothetical protein [Legionella taurinensis]MDX1838196.1 hypothetical protein [Legionella taurinensis]